MIRKGMSVTMKYSRNTAVSCTVFGILGFILLLTACLSTENLVDRGRFDEAEALCLEKSGNKRTLCFEKLGHTCVRKGFYLISIQYFIESGNQERVVEAGTVYAVNASLAYGKTEIPENEFLDRMGDLENAVKDLTPVVYQRIISNAANIIASEGIAAYKSAYTALQSILINLEASP